MIIKVWARFNLVGCVREAEIEVSDEDLEGLSEVRQEQVCEDFAFGAMNQMVEWGWTRLGEAD